MKKPLRILMINNYFPPEIGAASHLYYYLGKEFVKRGHQVTFLTGIPRYNVDKSIYNKYKSKAKRNVLIENIEGMEIIRIVLPYVDRRNILRRGIEHFEIAYDLYRYGKRYLSGHDVSIVYSPPLTLFWTAERIRKYQKTPFILNVQDLFPQAAIDLGVMKNPVIIKFFKHLEKLAYKSADIITVHSEENKRIVQETCEGKDKVHVIENWIDENEIKPGSKQNVFSEKFGLVDKFVVSFAGTLGFSQDVEVIVRAANELQNYKDIVFLIVGNGTRFDEAKKLINELNLNNVLLLPPVPKEEYSFILHSSDVSLVTLTRDVKTPVVPSKILSIMSAGIPVIACMNLEGDAPKLIEKAKAGFCVQAGDHITLVQKILLLYKDKDLKNELGKNGRSYVVNKLSVKIAADIYEKLFEKLI